MFWRICILLSALLLLFTPFIAAKRGYKLSKICKNSEKTLIPYLVQENVYAAPIYGNISETLYYYVNVYVGDPANPSKQALIVDTGSTATCLPCKEKCTKCGNHIFPQFSLSESSKASVEHCNGHNCECGESNECLFTSFYDEGSLYEGFYVTDYFQFSDNTLISKAPRYTFGCVTKETNLFLTQEANGIMGLAPVIRNEFKPVYYTYYETGFIKKLQFSLLLTKDGGVMYLGGYDSSVLLEPVQNIIWMKNIAEENYIVKFDSYSVGGQLLPGNLIKAKIDSGMTFVYTTKKQFNHIDQVINSLCRQGNYKCLGEKYSQGCYKFSPIQELTYEDFFYSYPVISFNMGSQKVHWYPNDYFYRKNPTTFCLAIEPFASDETKVVLGASFLRNNLAIFDIENKRIGIVRAALNGCENTQSSVNSCNIHPDLSPIIASEEDIIKYNRVSSTKSRLE
ncbi:unnamed protein product [Moneuplotes crassus]|uniref:Peptidase A1 domain-containing protein n=1 Tax=Euplotes crassus TaxID=5936 RepID=A0AAD1UL06_EUPCR|nr:unnamed protein product [Moneuplotes crassus]